jgi:hypothetical protein
MSDLSVTTKEIQQFPLWDKLKDKRVPLSFDVEFTDLAACGILGVELLSGGGLCQ